MRLREQMNVLLGAMIAIGAVSAFIFGYLVIVPEFDRLEYDNVLANVERLENLVESRTDSLAGQTANWAIWDDAYDYARGEYPEFADNEVTLSVMTNTPVDVIAHLSENGAPLDVRALGTDGKTFDPALAAEAAAALPSFIDPEDAMPRSGFVKFTDDRLMLAAIHPILRGDGSGPPAGLVVYAKKIDSTFLSKLSRDIKYPLVGAMIDGGMPSDFEAAFSRLVLDGRAVSVADGDTIHGYLPLKDLRGKPLYILRLDAPRDIHRQGLAAFLMFVAAALAFSVALMLLAGITLGTIIVRPLERVSATVRRISEGDRPKIVEKNSDEMRALSEELTRMVRRLYESRTATQRLADDLRKFKLAMESVSDMVVITDGTFRVLFANPAVDAVTGYPPALLVGQSAFGLWAGNDAEAEAAIRRTVTEERRAYSGETRGAKADGERFISELHVAPIVTERGDLAYCVGVMRDITKRKEIDRMKTEFVSLASHQLKTPLTGIKWFSELLMSEDSTLAAEQRDYLHQIYEVNERLIRLVNDMLNVSRLESGRKFAIEKKSADIVGVLSDVVTEQRIIAKKRGVRITVDAGMPKSLTLPIDKEKIRQAIHNLVNNAVKYSRDDGEVRLALADGEREAVLSVSDDGIGIPAAEQKKMFEKFFRASNTGDRDGTGLGMYIVKAIIVGHGGNIEFKSVENKGTTFRATLPKFV